MRKSRLADGLLTLIRQEILAATLLHPERSWYLSDLARHLHRRPSSLQRELASLVTAGVLRRYEDGNRVYFQADSGCPIFHELQSILVKTTGVVDVLADALAPFANRIEWAFVYGSIARADEQSTSDVDLMIIGDVGLADLSQALRRAEQQLGRPVNASLFSRGEVVKRLKTRHHFLQRVFDEQKLFILGDADELAAAIGQRSCATPRNESPGA